MSPRRVLLDECVPRKLTRHITGHEVQTVRGAGWASFKNGDLLRRAQTDFDVLVTIDRNFIYQQNLSNFQIAVIVLTRGQNKIEDLLPLITKLLEAIPVAEPGTAIVLETP
uniref:DUF5615 domain-containing protein n=1 Tax=Candidatus Kentrum sp. FM TaxID=2126340 RepID=A0A450X5W4_9GAMM|nr:MAG: hypothetical protein BECKFM1743C_GA0114222_108552 [Candidatus Kentron sp. FM]VFJ77681.1 MAG: hypothetical protein BECKFM1743A_GA0114220_110201 [Candidatus Kentron sp. FM]VFK24666.1 MAG: hypothetical protein BECKFM1743B_GA0114221_110091 [Candidatus Kentron sp. FM]